MSASYGANTVKQRSPGPSGGMVGRVSEGSESALHVPSEAPPTYPLPIFFLYLEARFEVVSADPKWGVRNQEVCFMGLCSDVGLVRRGGGILFP